MTKKDLLSKIKQSLEKNGTVFDDYYGHPIYSRGPKPREFFKSSNEGHFTVELLIIPSKFIITTLDETAISKFLEE